MKWPEAFAISMFSLSVALVIWAIAWSEVYSG